MNICPKVSVIVPCYNYGKHIEKCIMSILLQKLDYNIEILIGDDGSSDDSLMIANRMKKIYNSESVKFKIMGNDCNIGEIDNTKRLLENSEGEYIAYLDADDFWIDPLKLSKQIEFMDGKEEYSMCVTGYIISGEDNYVPTGDLSSWLCPRDLNKMDPAGLSLGNTVGSSSSRFFRNYSNITRDYFYEFPYSDWPMNFELSLRGKIKYLDFPGYVYTVHKNSLSDKDLNPSPDVQRFLYDKRINILSEILVKNNILN